MPDRPTRVALVSGRHDPRLDGVADYVERLAAGLQERGARPVVVTRRGGRAGDVPLLEAVTRWDAAGVAAAGRALEALDPDVVHVQLAPSAFGWSGAVGQLPVWLARAARPPRLVTTLHEYGWWSWPPGLPEPVRRLGERAGWDREAGLLTGRSDALVVTNPAHRDAVRRRTGRDPVQLPVPPGVPATAEPGSADAQALRAAERRERGWDDRTVVLAFFGFVHPVKGLRWLLDALAALRRTPPIGPDGLPVDLRLLVVGGTRSAALDGAEAALVDRDLAERVRVLGLGDVVTVTGFQDGEASSRALLAADVGALPFTHGVTTKSSSLLSLAAHHLPLLVTAGQDREPALVDGRTAVVVDRVRDARALEDGLRRLLGDDVLSARLRRASAVLARERSWDAVVAGHLALYERVLDAEARRARAAG